MPSLETQRYSCRAGLVGPRATRKSKREEKVSGKRIKQLRREFKQQIGRAPMTDVRPFGDGKATVMVGNEFRMYRRAGQRIAKGFTK
jgi:hypothetical protein